MSIDPPSLGLQILILPRQCRTLASDYQFVIFTPHSYKNSIQSQCSVAPGGGHKLRALDIHDVLLENQQQHELIFIQQNTLQMQEQTIRDLQVALDEKYGGNSPSFCLTRDVDTQSNADIGVPCQKFSHGDDTLCEQNTASRPSIRSP